MSVARHSLEEARALFPGVLDEEFTRVILSLQLYDNIEEYFTTNCVPAVQDKRNFMKGLTIQGKKPRYALYDGYLYKLEYKHGSAVGGVVLFRTLQEVCL